jgi:hypothetical protein
MHRAADERGWWKKVGVDPIKIARKLWRETRLKEGRIKQRDERETPDPTNAAGNKSDRPLAL